MRYKHKKNVIPFDWRSNHSADYTDWSKNQGLKGPIHLTFQPYKDTQGFTQKLFEPLGTAKSYGKLYKTCIHGKRS